VPGYGPTLSRQIADSQDPASLMPRVLRAALRETASERGLIGVLHEAKDHLEVVSQVGWRLGQSPSRMVPLSTSPFLAKAVRRRTSFSGSLVHQQNESGQESRRRPARSQLFLGTPLLLQDERRGILVVARDSPSYAAHEKTALETMAAMAICGLGTRSVAASHCDGDPRAGSARVPPEISAKETAGRHGIHRRLHRP